MNPMFLLQNSNDNCNLFYSFSRCYLTTEVAIQSTQRVSGLVLFFTLSCCNQEFTVTKTDLGSFIYIEHLYSASSRELLRGATDSSSAKKSSLKVRKKTQVTRL